MKHLGLRVLGKRALGNGDSDIGGRDRVNCNVGKECEVVGNGNWGFDSDARVLSSRKHQILHTISNTTQIDLRRRGMV